MNFINDNELNVIHFCYDTYVATQFAQNIGNYRLNTVEVRQGFQTLSEPTKDFRDYVYESGGEHKKITHIDDKTLSWAVGNAIAEMTANESINPATTLRYAPVSEERKREAFKKFRVQ